MQTIRVFWGEYSTKCMQAVNLVCNDIAIDNQLYFPYKLTTEINYRVVENDGGELVRKPLLGLSISIHLNSTCFHRLKPSNKKL